MENLRIDPEFQNKIPPLTQDEFERLESNILEDGEVREPIVVWIDAIVDGHNRWKIIQEHPHLPYKIKYMDFPDKWAAIAWMCHNQLGRRNISDVQKEMLMGEAYAAEKKTRGGDTGTEHGEGGRFTAFGQNGQMRSGSGFQSTRDRVAEEFGVGSRTIQWASDFVKGVNAADEIEPGFRDAVMTGEIAAPKKLIREIGKLDEEARPQVVAKIKEGDNLSAKEIIQSYKIPYPSFLDDMEEDETEEEERDLISVEELCDLVDAAMRTMEFALRLDLVDSHQDVLQQDGAVEAVMKSLDRGTKVIDQYKEILQSRWETNIGGNLNG